MRKRHKPKRKRTVARHLGCLSNKWLSPRDSDGSRWPAHGTPGSSLPQPPPEQEPAREHPYADPSRPVPNLECADRFENYYKAQHLVEPGWEWVQFIKTLHQPLPITFRLQPYGSLGAECRQSFTELCTQLDGQLPAMSELQWCACAKMRGTRPCQAPVHAHSSCPCLVLLVYHRCSSWSVAISKEALKASHEPAHVALQVWPMTFQIVRTPHTTGRTTLVHAPIWTEASAPHAQAWLTKWGALGAVNRQAIESMVPVCLLRIQPHHAVLDMCAPVFLHHCTYRCYRRCPPSRPRPRPPSRPPSRPRPRHACTGARARALRRRRRLRPSTHTRTRCQMETGRVARAREACRLGRAVVGSWWPMTWCRRAARCCSVALQHLERWPSAWWSPAIQPK